MENKLITPVHNEVRICTLGRVSEDKKKFILLDRYRFEMIEQYSPNPKFNEGRLNKIWEICNDTGRTFFMVQFTTTNEEHGTADANTFATVPNFESYILPEG